MAVVFTGGTISMTRDAATGGGVPTLRGDEILARTPGIDQIADLEPIDWGLVPASHLTFAQLLDLARTVRAVLEREDVVGAVVVQGTDTIEETGFAFDLLLPGPKPIVVTGAMRGAEDDGYDGPENLRAAVRCASSAQLQDQGCVVVMAGSILPADDATKAHAQAYASFTAPNHGPLGTVGPHGVTVTAHRARRRTLPLIPEAAAEPILLVVAVLGMDVTHLQAAVESGVRGIVVAATGAGNTDPALLALAAQSIARGVPVVITTRCVAGRSRPSYGFSGGGVGWARAGAIFPGTLSGPKARIALALALGAGVEGDELRDLLAG